MGTPNGKVGKKGFTTAEKAILYGLAQKIAVKRNCSNMYVRHIIMGTRNTNTVLSQNILKDLRALLELLRPET